MIANIKKQFTRFNNTRGFTMIELAVVIAIIGVLSTIAIKSFTESRVHLVDAVALAETRGLGKAVIDAFLEEEDVDFTHNIGDGPVIGTMDTAGNPRRPVFRFSPGIRVTIVGSSNVGGTGKGICAATVTHTSGSKTYNLIVDEVNNITSFPGI
jgi:prepilin-type N-terminal cleavage/methylation domain-containing protein